MLLFFGGKRGLENAFEVYKRKKQVHTWESRVSTFEKEVQLQGHWHLRRRNAEEYSTGKDLPTIDFENDTLAILRKYQGGYGGVLGDHDAAQKTIRFEREGFSAYYRYTIDRKTLNLVSEDGENTSYFSATRCDILCCYRQGEFFFGMDIDIY